jgi:hypothetical protein
MLDKLAAIRGGFFLEKLVFLRDVEQFNRFFIGICAGRR